MEGISCFRIIKNGVKTDYYILETVFRVSSRLLFSIFIHWLKKKPFILNVFQNTNSIISKNRLFFIDRSKQKNGNEDEMFSPLKKCHVEMFDTKNWGTESLLYLETLCHFVFGAGVFSCLL